MDELIVSFVQKYPVVSTVVAGLLAAHALAVFVVNLTPTPADDRIVGKVYKFIEYIAGVISGKAKEFPGEAATKKGLETFFGKPEDSDDEGVP